MYKQTVIIVCLVAIAAALFAGAIGVCADDQVPQIINYQGRLRSADGSPVADATYGVRFTIYDSESGGASQWTETQSSVAVTGGVFHVLLGSANPIGASVFPAGADRWLGVKVGEDAELSPRQKIASVPFSLRADTVSPSSIGSTEIADNAVVAAKIANGAVTSDKIGAGAVGSGALASDAASLNKVSAGAVSVSGGKISGDGSLMTDLNGSNIAGGTITADKLASGVATPPGVVQAYAGSSAPTGWLTCDGSAVSRTTYAALFAAIGTAYGSGNGATTFNLPNLADRFPMGKSGTRALGTTGGAATVDLSHTHTTANHTLTVAEMPAHSHSSTDIFKDYNGGGTVHFYLAENTSSAVSTPMGNSSTGGDGAHNHGNTGSALSSSQSIVNPYQVVNYIIKY